MTLDRCKAKIHTREGTLQCEGLDGHQSAHFSGDHWWPNKHGLPWSERTNWLGFIVVALIIAAAIAFLLWL